MRRLPPSRFAALAAAALTLSPVPALSQANDRAYETATRVGAAIEACWFKSGDAAFAGYVYSPEPNASGGPRILIVPRDQPAATPLLAIQFVEQKGGMSIRAFGPLATSAEAPRIGADLKRWLAGGSGCR